MIYRFANDNRPLKMTMITMKAQTIHQDDEQSLYNSSVIKIKVQYRKKGQKLVGDRAVVIALTVQFFKDPS